MKRYVNLMKSPPCAIMFLCLLIGLSVPSSSFPQQQGTPQKILIVYHSLTGNTRACCEALQQALDADILEIKDLVDRTGSFGFFRSAIGSLLGMHTEISPEQPDLSPYTNIIIAAPIWTGKLSMAARTFIHKNRFEGKKVAIFATTNAFEKEEYKEKSRELVRKAGGEVVGYYQVLAKEESGGEKVDRPLERIVEDALQCVPEIQKAFNLFP